MFLMSFIILTFFAIVKHGNISPGRKYHYEEIYLHNNVRKFCGAHILIKFVFGCKLIYKSDENPLY